MPEPPSLTGAAKAMLICPLPGVAAIPVGTPGCAGVCGVNWAVAKNGARLVPAPLVAVNLHW